MHWLEQHAPELVLWVTVASLLMLACALAVLPWVVSRLPADYFNTLDRKPFYRQYGPAGVLLSLLKNLLGLILLVLGLVMLVTPGQGLLTMLLGLLLMNFPGKYRLERAVARRKGVMKALNWMRRRKGQPPFESLDSDA